MNPPDREAIQAAINRVAAAIPDRAEFGERAAAEARALGPGAIDTLATLYHAQARPPAEHAGRFAAPGAWLSARQFAIFEIYFHLGRPAVPELVRVVRDDYDWIQGNAVEVLARLAARGIEREAILVELAQQLPSLREEAHAYAIRPLVELAEEDAAVARVLDELLRIEAFAQAYAASGAPPRVRPRPWWKIW